MVSGIWLALGRKEPRLIQQTLLARTDSKVLYIPLHTIHLIYGWLYTLEWHAKSGFVWLVHTVYIYVTCCVSRCIIQQYLSWIKLHNQTLSVVVIPKDCRFFFLYMSYLKKNFTFFKKIGWISCIYILICWWFFKSRSYMGKCIGIYHLPTGWIYKEKFGECSRRFPSHIYTQDQRRW